MLNKIDMNALHSKYLSLATTLFQYCVALMPALYLLNVPIINMSFGSILLIIFLPYSFYHVVRWFKESERKFKNFGGMLLFGVFYLYMCFRADGSLTTIAFSLFTLVHIYGIFCGSVQLEKVRRILVTYAMISVGLVVIQTVACYLLNWRIQYVPRSFVHEQFRNSYIFTDEGGLFRPSALFMEPAHFAQYCCFAIIFLLFPEEGEPDLERAVIISVSCVLTTSGMGIVLVCGLACCYLFVEYILSGKIRAYSAKQILRACLLVLIALFCVSLVPFVRTALLRVFSTVDGYNAIAGRLGLWKLQDAIGTMDAKSLLLGYGNNANYRFYLTGLADTIYKHGLVGVFLQIVCWGWLMLRKRNVYVWCTCLSFLMLFVVAHLTGFFTQIFYFGLVIADVVSVKKKAEVREEVTAEQVKEIGYRILCDVAEFCESHGIQYFLACGTALGAIRHNGFIPWDDDVDICMPRPDYERFLDLYDSSQYELYDTRYQKNYPYAFAKVCDRNTELIEYISDPCPFGVYIDVFPIDGLPDDEVLLKKHMDKLQWNFRLLVWKRMPRGKKLDFPHKLVLLIAKSVLHVVPIRYLVRKLEYDVKRYSYTRSQYVGHLVSPAPWGTDVKPKAVFENPVRHVFEKQEFFVPGDVDKYLTLEYGDYMQLPPKEKQVAKHNFVAHHK